VARRGACFDVEAGGAPVEKCELGPADAAARLLLCDRGRQIECVPPIFDPAQIDRKFLVDSADSLRATRELTAREGIFSGISSGALTRSTVLAMSVAR